MVVLILKWNSHELGPKTNVKVISLFFFAVKTIALILKKERDYNLYDPCSLEFTLTGFVS